MLEIKADENFKASTRHWFHNTASSLEHHCVKALEDAIDDDVHGQKVWAEDARGAMKPVTDASGAQLRTPTTLSTAVLEVLGGVDPASMFEQELAKLKRWEDSFTRDQSVETHRARLNRVEADVKAVLFDAASKLDKLARDLEDALGVDIASMTKTFRVCLLSMQALLRRDSAGEFIESSSENRTERAQRLLETDRLSEFTTTVGTYRPAFATLRAEACNVRCVDAFNVYFGSPEVMEHALDDDEFVRDTVHEAENAVCEVMADELDAELKRQAQEIFEPNESLASLEGDVIPKIVTRTVFSEHKGYGLVRHIRDRLYDLLEDVA